MFPSFLSVVLYSALSDHSLISFTCCLRLSVLICTSFLSPVHSILFLVSLCGHHQYQSHLCLVIHFLIVSFPRCSRLLPCYPSLFVLFKPRCFSWCLLVHLIPTCCSLWTCPIFLPPVLASFSLFTFICLFYDFLVFDPCLDFGLSFGFACFSAPLPQSDWLPGYRTLPVYWISLSALPLPIKRLPCGAQQNCRCVSAFESFPRPSALTHKDSGRTCKLHAGWDLNSESKYLCVHIRVVLLKCDDFPRCRLQLTRKKTTSQVHFHVASMCQKSTLIKFICKVSLQI